MAAEAIGDTAKEKRADPSARFKIDEDYADTWTTDFGGALGSMAAFMGAGAIGGPFGYLFAGGTGLTQGRERLEAAKAEGQEVSQGCFFHCLQYLCQPTPLRIHHQLLLFLTLILCCFFVTKLTIFI